jgi:hypothetical protein
VEQGGEVGHLLWSFETSVAWAVPPFRLYWGVPPVLRS